MTTGDGSVLGVKKIVDNGPDSRRWNLVFMGDGYQAHQITTAYTDNVQSVVEVLFQTRPFDNLKTAINVYRIDVASTEFGADDPVLCGGSGVTARTYFDASFCNHGSRRMLLVNDTTVINTVNAQVPQWDVAAVLVNSNVPGGAASGSILTCSLQGGNLRLTANSLMHELGHSGFRLADEYEYFLGCGVDTDRNNHPAGEPIEANVTLNTNRASLKWRHLVAASTAVPTTTNADCNLCDPQPNPVPAGTVGLFEGAHTYHCGAFRPEYTCKMRILWSPFCAVCLERIGAIMRPYEPAAQPIAVTTNFLANGEASATPRGTNRMDVFVRGTDRAVYHKWWDGISWMPSLSGYERLGGVIDGAPVVESWGSGRLDVFVRDTNGVLYHKWWDGSSWQPSLTGYESLGGAIHGQPKVVSQEPDRLDVFVVGTDRALYTKWWDGSSWKPSLTGYTRLGDLRIEGSPEVVSQEPNRLDVFVVGAADRALYTKWWDGSSWKPSLTGYTRLGDAIAILGQPKVVSQEPNWLDVFVVGAADRALYTKWWDGSSWKPSLTGYTRLGGIIEGSPEVVSQEPNRLDVFVVGTDRALYTKWWDGSSWKPSLTGYTRLGGGIFASPTAVAWGAHQLDVFVVGTADSALYTKWWDGSSWKPSLTGYTRLGGIIDF